MVKIEKAKPIVGILTSKVELLDEIIKELSEYFGAADIIGEWIPFDHTNYYEDEMGKNLKRSFVSFERLIQPFCANNFKPHTAKIEDKFRKNGKRTINLDAGYLDANKVVLMTGKHGGHKIAISSCVWADMLLWYNKGWVAFPWAFPDFRDGKLFPLFTKMRTHFKKQTKIIGP